MASINFDACLALTLSCEGGYSDHPDDPGGATNFGVTRATLSAFRGHSVGKSAVRALTKSEAAPIYRRMYWDAVCGDDLPGGLDAALFDHAVNSGPVAAIRLLQKILGVKVDGRLGPSTVAALRNADRRALIRDFCAARRSFLQRLRSFRIFGRGWLARVAKVERSALTLAA